MTTPAVDERAQAAVAAVLNLIRQLSEAAAEGQPRHARKDPARTVRAYVPDPAIAAVVHNERQRSDTRSRRCALR